MIRIIATAVMMMFLVAGQAQKLGHLNSSALLIDYPKVKQADQQVMEFQQTKEVEFQTKTASFQKEYEAFIMKAQSQDYSEVQLQKEQMVLAEKEKLLQQLQYDLQRQIQLKREELYAPILMEVEAAVKAVGEENGFTMIFDTSLGGVLYGLETQDITPLVKTKLGI